VDVDPAIAVETPRLDDTLRAESAIGGDLDESDGLEPRSQARLGLDPALEIAGVTFASSWEVSDVEPKVTIRPAACHVVPTSGVALEPARRLSNPYGRGDRPRSSNDAASRRPRGRASARPVQTWRCTISSGAHSAGAGCPRDQGF